MAIHSSILALKIPWTEERGGPQSTGLQTCESAHMCMHTHTHTHTHENRDYHLDSTCGEAKVMETGLTFLTLYK